MFCKYCGAPLADGAVFCAHCGSLRQNTYVPPRTRAQSSPYMPAAAYALPRTLPPAAPAKEQTNVFGVIGLLCSLVAALPLCFAAGLLPCCLCFAALGAVEAYFYFWLLILIYLGAIMFVVFLFFAPAFGIVGIVVSAIGLGVRRSYRRSGTAAAGLVLGILFTALSLAALVLLVANGYAA